MKKAIWVGLHDDRRLAGLTSATPTEYAPERNRHKMSVLDTMPMSVVHEAGKTTPFVPLPIRHGELIRALGQPPSEAAVAVDPFEKLDDSLTVIQSFIAAVCDNAGRVCAPLELTLMVDPGAVPAKKQTPILAMLRAYQELPERLAELPPLRGFDAIGALLDTTRAGPLLYCRKVRSVFVARSRSGRGLHGVDLELSGQPDADAPLPALINWDGPASDDQAPVTLYGGRGGNCELGLVETLDQLIQDQGKVVRLWEESRETNHENSLNLSRTHACCGCGERDRCYPPDDGYGYAADRLAVLSAASGPILVRPLGEWRLDEAAAAIGGAPLSSVDAGGKPNEFELWRKDQARAFHKSSAPRLLAGESDGRELLEVARVKLALIADTLAQLDGAWRVFKRPHLCWNHQTVRVAWRPPAQTPGAIWGFQPLLRKIGLAPLAAFETPSGTPMSYPPEFTIAELAAPEVIEAGRYFDEPRAANVFVKTAKPDGQVTLLLEELNIAWRLFAPGDAIRLSGPGWQALLSPAASRDPNDGEGLPFVGKASAPLKAGDTIRGVEMRWLPRFGEAVDLHALGMLCLGALLGQDERRGGLLFNRLLKERDELTRSCLALPIEQREKQARQWLSERSEVDAPAAIWSRRNLLFRREDRNATRLDAFPAQLWQAILMLGLRMITAIPGFSYCGERDASAPRLENGLLLPHAELRGLIALLDDLIFGRSVPGGALRETLKK